MKKTVSTLLHVLLLTAVHLWHPVSGASDSLCAIDEGKSRLKCGNQQVFGQEASISVSLNKCANPITLSFNIKVKALGIDWTHDLRTDQDIPIPTFDYKVAGVGAGVFVKTELYKGDKKVRVKLRLVVKLSLSGIEMQVPPITVFDGDLPIDSECSPAILWWNGTKTGEKVGIIGGACLLLLLLILGGILCCRRRKSSRRSGPAPWRPAIFKKSFWLNFRQPRRRKFKESNSAMWRDVEINMHARDDPNGKTWKVPSSDQGKTKAGGVSKKIYGYEKKTHEAGKTDVEKQLKAKKKRNFFR